MVHRYNLQVPLEGFQRCGGQSISCDAPWGPADSAESLCPVTEVASIWIKIRGLVGRGARPLPAADESWTHPALCVKVAETIH